MFSFIKQAPQPTKHVASKEDAQVDWEQDHGIVRWQDPRIKWKSRKSDQIWNLVEALTSRTGSQTQRLLHQTIQVAAGVAQGRADGDTTGDAAVVAKVKAVKEIAAAVGKTIKKEGINLITVPG